VPEQILHHVEWMLNLGADLSNWTPAAVVTLNLERKNTLVAMEVAA